LKRTKITRHKNIANNLIIKNHQILSCKLILNNTVLFGNISKKAGKDNILVYHFYSSPFCYFLSSVHKNCLEWYSIDIFCWRQKQWKGGPSSQFHQHFTCTFFIRKCFAQLFSSYVLALAKGFRQNKHFRTKNLSVKCWWNWPQTEHQSWLFFKCQSKKVRWNIKNRAEISSSG